MDCWRFLIAFTVSYALAHDLPQTNISDPSWGSRPDDWMVEHPGAKEFAISDGVLTITPRAGLVRTRQTLAPFRLQFDAQLLPPAAKALLIFGGDSDNKGDYALPLVGDPAAIDGSRRKNSLIVLKINQTGLTNALRPGNASQTYTVYFDGERFTVSLNSQALVTETHSIRWIGFRAETGSLTVHHLQIQPVHSTPARTTRAGDNEHGAFGPEIQLDTKGVEFGPWIRRFISQVRSNWFVPYASSDRKGHVEMTFDIDTDGSITDVQVANSSEIIEFDNAARVAILGSSPTQPLPPGYSSPKAHFTVTFHYNQSPSSSGNSVSSLLKMTASDVETRLGKATAIDGRRWKYETTGGVLFVYFDDDHVVDLQSPWFDLAVFKK